MIHFSCFLLTSSATSLDTITLSSNPSFFIKVDCLMSITSCNFFFQPLCKNFRVNSVYTPYQQNRPIFIQTLRIMDLRYKTDKICINTFRPIPTTVKTCYCPHYVLLNRPQNYFMKLKLKLYGSGILLLS